MILNKIVVRLQYTVFAANKSPQIIIPFFLDAVSRTLCWNHLTSKL